MSTLTDLSLREVFETPGSRVVADLLVREGFAVAEAEGIVIPQDEAAHILDKVLPCFFFNGLPLKEMSYSYPFDTLLLRLSLRECIFSA